MKNKDLINVYNMGPLKFHFVISLENMKKKKGSKLKLEANVETFKDFLRLHFLSALILAFDAQNRSPGSVESRHILQSVAFGCRARSITAAPLSAAFCGRGKKKIKQIPSLRRDPLLSECTSDTASPPPRATE